MLDCRNSADRLPCSGSVIGVHRVALENVTHSIDGAVAHCCKVSAESTAPTHNLGYNTATDGDVRAMDGKATETDVEA